MLEALIKPKSVAVYGASRSPGKVGYDVVANLKKGGFAGPILPINPSADEILGLKCYPDLKSSGQTVDLAVLVVPTKHVPGAARDAIAGGAKAIICITAGFKETGAEGKAKELELTQICREAGVRLMGPNCLGLINGYHKMNASFAAKMPPAGGISVLSQSGALCTAILDWADERRIGIGKLMSIGNKADVDETDLLRALADDDETKVIVAYLESIMQGPEFVKAAEIASRKKPVIVFKAGSTSAGAKAASSHTGSLAGGDKAYAAAFEQCGIVRADDFEILFDCAVAMYMQPPPKGKRVCIVTNAGGPGIMCADAAEQAGFEVGSLTPAVADALRPLLPSSASVANPVDVLGDADHERYGLALRAAYNDDAVDAMIVVLTPQSMTRFIETAELIAEVCKDRRKPVLSCFMGGTDVKAARARLVELQIPDYPSPDRAVKALRHMYDYSMWLQRPVQVATQFPVNKRRVETIIEQHRKAGLTFIGEAAGKEIMTAYGFTVPKGQLCTSADEAVSVADSVGYPVAMKIASPDIIHKSDMGGVRLNLATADAVRDAFDLMMLRCGRRAPTAKLEGVYLERMAPKGREIILGMSRDPQFGPMVMFGIGGVFVEVMKDVTFHLTPISAQDALDMIKATKSYNYLKGVRGQAGSDIDAIALGIQRVSQLVTDFPEIEELDINPFMVGPVGAGAIVADARILLTGNQPKAH